jgi:hypothetical protein
LETDLRREFDVDEEKLRSRIAMLAQLTGVFALITYGAGFLILSLHHASFGISQFNLLRPKIISAGVLFFVLAALAAIETTQAFSFQLGIDKLPETHNIPVPPRRDVRWVYSLAFLLIALVVSALLLRQYLGDSPLGDALYPWTLGALLPSAAAFATIPFVLMRKRQWELTACVVVVILSVLWMAFCIYRTRDTTFSVLVGWFLLCSYDFYLVRGALKDIRQLPHVNWVQALTLAMGTLVFFGIQVYPRIRSGFGGGSPSQATVQFVDKSPFDATGKARVWFIDETDFGFYVIRSKEAKKAIFLPRNTIAAVYFGEDQEQPKGEQSKKETTQDARHPKP